MNVPFLGCDGLPGTGQTLSAPALLTATVVIPPNAGTAIEAVVSAIQTGNNLPSASTLRLLPFHRLKSL